MARTRTENSMRPALTPEARENQLISMAHDVAEQRMRDGTASSQLICYYLKLGSAKERLEKEILKQQKELMEAKTEAIRSEKDLRELYTEAMKAMREYQGVVDDEEYE